MLRSPQCYHAPYSVADATKEQGDKEVFLEEEFHELLSRTF